MSLKLIFLLILNIVVIKNLYCFDQTPFVSERREHFLITSTTTPFDYDITADNKFDSKNQLDCKSDLNCLDSNSACINGSCVRLCSFTDPLKFNKNCYYFHCDSKQLITSLNNNSSPIETNSYPNLPRYLSKKKCSWVLKNSNRSQTNSSTDNSYIQLSIDRFSTQFANDYLYIFAGDSIYSPLIGSLSGSELASIDPSQETVSLDKDDSSNKTLNLTFLNTTNLFLLFKSDVFTSHSSFKSINTFDDSKPIGIGIKYKFSSSCQSSNESNPLAICTDQNSETNIQECENCDSKLIENVKYQNSDTLNILNTSLNRAYHCSFLYEGYLYAVGGYSFSKKISFLSRLNLTSLIWEHNIDKTPSTIVNRSNRNFFANSSNYEKPKIELPSNRYSHSCALDSENRRFYMYGGIIYDIANTQNSKKTTNELWMFNLETNKWFLLNDLDTKKSFRENKNYELPIGVSGHSMHFVKKSLSEQSLYIFFGYSEYYGSTLNLIQEFNLVSKTWSYNQTSYLNIGYGHTSIYDNRTNVIYFHGGLVLNPDRYSNTRNSQSPFISSFIYSFSLIGFTWTELTRSIEPAFMQSAVLFNNKILFFGGIIQSDDYQKFLYKSNKMKLYETIKNEFIQDFNFDSLKTSFKVKNRHRYAHTSFIYDNYMYIFGGFNGFCLSDMFRINLREISDVQKIEINFRKKRTDDLEDMFGNRINRLSSSLVDIDFVAKYEIPTSFANRQLSLNEACNSHKICNVCNLDPNCVWNDKICEHFIASNSSKLIYRKPSCSQMCNEFSSCSNCTSLVNVNGQYQNNCVWCASQSKCIQKKALSVMYPFGECFDLVSDREQCEIEVIQPQTGAKIILTPCSQLYSNCSSCITDERCGWCSKDSLDQNSLNTGFGICVEGGESSSLNNVCKQNWFFSNCPLCECNGHSVCENSSSCSKCMNNTKGDYCSECKQGFFGKAYNNGACRSCECGEQASDCDNSNGKCFCHTKGVAGSKCDTCDSPRYTGRPNTTDGSCYYNLTTDYQFTFNLNKDSDRYYTKINFVNHPTRGSDDDIDFMVRCFKSTALINVSYVVDDFSESSYDSYVVPDYNQNPVPMDFLDNLTIVFNNMTEHYSPTQSVSYYQTYDSSGYYFGPMSRYNVLLETINCSNSEFKHTFTNRELNYADKSRNLIFIVNVYNFQTPITIQIAFSRKSKIQLLHFFITFFGCLLSLLTIAFVTWKSKQRFDRYRRQRQIVIQMEHMASRPFTRLLVDISEDVRRDQLDLKSTEKDDFVKDKKTRRSYKKNDKKTKFFKNSDVETDFENDKNEPKLKVMPIGVEPLSNNKSAIVTCLLRLPQGGQNGIPKGSSLFMLGSTYVSLNSSCGLLANSSNGNEQKIIDDESDNQAGKTVES